MQRIRGTLGLNAMDLSKPIRIEGPKQLEKITAAILAGVSSGEFEILSGDLQWADYVECKVRKKQTGEIWWVHCETYHGSGGAWEPLGG